MLRHSFFKLERLVMSARYVVRSPRPIALALGLKHTGQWILS